MLAIVTACAAIILALATPAVAQTEAEYRDVLCASMETEVVLPGGARVDCVDDVFAWEMDFSGKWAEAIGQALFYAAATDKSPGIILICRKQIDTCHGHLDRVLATMGRWNLPITIWLHTGGL